MEQANESRKVTARAYANIALCKYWGKAAPEHVPATPSIGLALSRLSTTTTVNRRRRGDQVLLDGKPAGKAERTRIVNYLDLWRDAGLATGAFRVESANSFPTGAGLASSSSGFAALATALGGLAPRPVGTGELSRLARRGSGSAARSITGGLSALGTGKNPAAKLIETADRISWRMVLAVIDAPAKDVGSTAGMELCAHTSPYYAAWVRTARRDYREMLHALRCCDIDGVGAVMEANMLAMHACILASRPAPFYWQPATLAVLAAVREWRNDGLAAYATVDAGPHAAVLCRLCDMPTVAARLQALAAKMQGIKDVLTGGIAGPAEIIATE